jgi:hypothetical protein
VQALVHTCAFCGSSQVLLKDAPGDILRPRFLIPFEVDAAQCNQLTRQWLGSSWMVPSALDHMADHAEFKGVFLPFWTFDSVTSASWQAEVGYSEHERYYQDGEWKVRTVIRWRWENGKVREQFDDLLVPGTGRLSSRLLHQIKGFDIAKLRAYEPEFLAGFQALAYDKELENAWEAARDEMREKTRQACRNQASTSQIRNFSMSLDFSDESWRYILLPVYLAGYLHKDSNYQVLINGQTGAISGQRPVDWTKVWLVIAAILCPGVLLTLVGLATLLLGGVGILFGGIGFILIVAGTVFAAMILHQAMAMDDA